MTCPNCGNELPVTNPAYCTQCGFALTSASVPPSPENSLLQGVHPSPFPPASSPNLYASQVTTEGTSPTSNIPPNQSRNGISPLLITLAIIFVFLLGGLGGGLGVLVVTGRFGTSSTQHVSDLMKATTTPLPQYSVFFQDPLTSDKNNWANDSNCSFQTNGYHVRNQKICYAPVGSVVNGIISVSMQQISGPLDYGDGLGFRVSSGPNGTNGYNFGITPTGVWVFDKLTNGQFVHIQDYTATLAIHQGLQASNVLKVVTQGSSFTFYINNVMVGQATDTTYTTGKCGVYGGEGGSEEVFTNFEVQLPMVSPI